MDVAGVENKYCGSLKKEKEKKVWAKLFLQTGIVSGTDAQDKYCGRH